ncbi:MAG: response regulator, partial [Acetobacteraceae bacterium]|nr:response regulator [Acetobacteraceae bacterium]
EIKRRWPTLPVMMITAYGDAERRRAADAFGAADFLSKPIDFDHLKQRIQAFAPTAPPP